MAAIALTQYSLQNTKRALISKFPNLGSAHLSEALAAACGHKTHAALLDRMQAGNPDDPDYVLLDEEAFFKRLGNLTRGTQAVRSMFPDLEGLPLTLEQGFIKTASSRQRKIRFVSQRDRAWRNLMVAAVNAGIDQRLFTVRPGDNRWAGAKAKGFTGRGETHVYRFIVGGIPAIASVSDAGWDELSIHAALWPTPDADRWIVCANAGFLAGEANATSWLERMKGAWLQVARDRFLACRKHRLGTVAALDLRPNGYADRGSFCL